MKLSKTRYIITLTAQLTLLTSDLLFNAFSNYNCHNNGILLLLFVLQDFFQIFAVVLLLFTFFQTSVFQAGFVKILYKKFWPTLVTSTAYFLISIILHTWTLFIKWNTHHIYNWPLGLHCCFIAQRILSAIYYYAYKRTALRISDQRLYEDQWINHKVNHKT